jgi:hypothetical protein
MSSLLFVFVIIIGLAYNVSGTLYGIITEFNGNNTQTVVYTVTVDPSTGKFTHVAENFIYIGSSATYDGIAAFDQKKNYLYYSTDFEASFVYGIDVTKGEILPPISINSETITSIDWDGKNQQLLILGIFQDRSSAVYTFPYSGPSVLLINFTAQGINTPQTTFLDWAKGMYYLVYFDAAKSQYNLGSFPISSPKAVQSTPLNCGKTFSPDYLFLDSSSGILFGVGFDSSVSTYKYYTIKGTACTVSDIGLTGVVTAATYDPTKNILQMGYVDKATGPNMVTLDTASSKVVSKIPTQRVLEDLQVSYQV